MKDSHQIERQEAAVVSEAVADTTVVSEAVDAATTENAEGTIAENAVVGVDESIAVEDMVTIGILESGATALTIIRSELEVSLTRISRLLVTMTSINSQRRRHSNLNCIGNHQISLRTWPLFKLPIITNDIHSRRSSNSSSHKNFNNVRCNRPSRISANLRRSQHRSPIRATSSGALPDQTIISDVRQLPKTKVLGRSLFDQCGTILSTFTGERGTWAWPGTGKTESFTPSV